MSREAIPTNRCRHTSVGDRGQSHIIVKVNSPPFLVEMAKRWSIRPGGSGSSFFVHAARIARTDMILRNQQRHQRPATAPSTPVRSLSKQRHRLIASWLFLGLLTGWCGASRLAAEVEEAGGTQPQAARQARAAFASKSTVDADNDATRPSQPSRRSTADKTNKKNTTADAGTDADQRPNDPPPIANDPYGPFVAQTLPLSPEEQRKKFHLPPGFEIQLVVSEPSIHKPMNMNFDSAGQLWVTHSVEYPYPAKDRPGKDALSIVQQIGADGRAGRVVTFAGGLNIPIGVVPLPGGALTYSIPNIYFLHDRDGDLRADDRESYYESIAHRDTHGMTNSFTRWIDGWIYACHGFSNTSRVHGRDGKEIVMNSGNTYRMRPDGSHLEYFTHGQVNPFGLAFDPLGNLYSADCHSRPVYMLLRGAWYPSFGKPHDGLGFGPSMINHDHGSTGIAGVVYYAAEHFPPEYRNTVFIGNPVTGRINHDRLEPHGSSYQAIEQPDFITCDDPWFRPVDLQLGPDGALYIADFYNCIIGHYEVPLDHPRRDRWRGRIWRVVYRGDSPSSSGSTSGSSLRTLPNLQTESIEMLLRRLADPNLTIRVLATNEIIDRFGKDPTTPSLVAALLKDDASAEQRAHALWIVERLKGLSAAQIEMLSTDREPLVRTHLLKALAERTVWESAIDQVAVRMLEDADPFVRRAAADALGQHPDHVAEHIASLLRLWRATPSDDTHLIHVVRMAIRNHLKQQGAYARVENLVADADSFSRLADVSLGVHSSDSARFVLRFLSSGNYDGERLGEYLHYAARYIDEPQWPSVFAYAEIFQGSSTDNQATVLRSLRNAAQERSKPLPEFVVRWARTLTEQLLHSRQSDEVRTGIEFVQEFGLPEAYDQLQQLALSRRRNDIRRMALNAMVTLDGQRALQLLEQLLSDSNESIIIRQFAANQLAKLNNEQSRAILVRHLQNAPAELAARIAQALCQNKTGGELLLSLVEQGKASPWLLRETSVKRRLESLKLPDIERRITDLTAQLPEKDDRLRRLMKQRRRAFAKAKLKDPVRGAAVFKKHCAACHRINGEGNKIGPELDGIGLRGVDRLIEDMLDPSRNVDQAFRATLVVTDDGRVVSGLVLREEGNVLILADSQGREVRVPIDRIDERQQSALSPMPANVAELVSPEDFNHLLAYLLKQRAKPAP